MSYVENFCIFVEIIKTNMFKFLKRLFGFGKPEITLPPFEPVQQEDKVIYHVEPEQVPASEWPSEAPTAPVVEEPKVERTTPAERGIDQLGMPKLPTNEGTKPTKKRRPYKKRKPKTMKAPENKA